MTALIGIVCDGCGDTRVQRTYTQMSATGVRASAKERGWHQTRGRTQAPGTYARDICPQCWEKGVR